MRAALIALSTLISGEASSQYIDACDYTNAEISRDGRHVYLHVPGRFERSHINHLSYSSRGDLNYRAPTLRASTACLFGSQRNFTCFTPLADAEQGPTNLDTLTTQESLVLAAGECENCSEGPLREFFQDTEAQLNGDLLGYDLYSVSSSNDQAYFVASFEHVFRGRVLRLTRAADQRSVNILPPCPANQSWTNSLVRTPVLLADDRAAIYLDHSTQSPLGPAPSGSPTIELADLPGEVLEDRNLLVFSYQTLMERSSPISGIDLWAYYPVQLQAAPNVILNSTRCSTAVASINSTTVRNGLQFGFFAYGTNINRVLRELSAPECTSQFAMFAESAWLRFALEGEVAVRNIPDIPLHFIVHHGISSPDFYDILETLSQQATSPISVQLIADVSAEEMTTAVQLLPDNIVLESTSAFLERIAEREN